MTDEPRSTHPSWLKIGALGCAGSLGLVVLFFGGLAAITFWGYRGALEVREEVDRRYGAFDSYQVPADGTVPAERMARFLAIRKALMPRCAEVTDIAGSLKSVEEAAHQDEPDVGEIFRRVGRVARRMPSMGLAFGEYVSDRNDALLEQGMGLGEYTWIYVVGYFADLGQPPLRVLDEQNRLKPYQDRIYPEIARVVERHIAQGGLTAGPWVEELARLRADRERVPFRGALPPELAASLEPFRGALTAFACPAAAELDLTITVRRSTVGFDHR